jgi:hypothetical protein
MARPSVLAVFRLTTSSNLVGCITRPDPPRHAERHDNAAPALDALGQLQVSGHERILGLGVSGKGGPEGDEFGSLRWTRHIGLCRAPCHRTPSQRRDHYLPADACGSDAAAHGSRTAPAGPAIAGRICARQASAETGAVTSAGGSCRNAPRRVSGKGMSRSSPAWRPHRGDQRSRCQVRQLKLRWSMASA